MVSFATVAHVQEINGNTEVTQKTKGDTQIGVLPPFMMFTVNSTEGKHIRVTNRGTKVKSLMIDHTTPVLGIRTVQGPNLVASFTSSEVIVWSIDKSSVVPVVLNKWAHADIAEVQWVHNETKLKPDLLVAFGKGKYELVCLSLDAAVEQDIKTSVVIAKNIAGPHFAGASTSTSRTIAYAESADKIAANIDGKVVSAEAKGIVAISVSAGKTFRVIVGTSKGNVHVFEAGSSLNQVLAATAGDKNGALPVQWIGQNGKFTVVCAGKVLHVLQMNGPLAIRNVAVKDDTPTLAAGVVAGEEVFYCGNSEHLKSVALVGKATQFVPLPTKAQAASSSSSPVAAAAPAPAAAAAAAATSNPLRNPTLASKADSKGVSQEVSQAIANLSIAIQNTRAATARASEARRREVEDLVDIALSAQQQGLRQSAGVSEGGVELTEDVVRRLMAQLAEGIKIAIVPAVESAASDICARAAKDGVKAGSSKASEAALRTAVDDAVKGVATGFAEHLKAKSAANEAVLRNTLRRMSASSEEAIRKLRKDKADLEAQLNIITNSNILQEVRNLRDQVAKLKEGQQGPAVVARPEDVASTAFTMASEGHLQEALQHVVSSRVPQAAITLMNMLLKDQTTLDQSVTGDVWGAFLTMSASFVSSSEHVYDFVDIAYTALDACADISKTVGLYEVVAAMRDQRINDCDKVLAKELNTLVNEFKN